MAVHDYQHGSVIVRVYAESKADVATLLRPPSWVVYLEGEDGCPTASGVKILESDADAHEPWLQKLLYVQDRKSEGKTCFFFVSEIDDQVWEVWARTEAEVLTRYPKLKSMRLKPLTSEMLGRARVCDIDDASSFQRHKIE